MIMLYICCCKTLITGVYISPGYFIHHMIQFDTINRYFPGCSTIWVMYVLVCSQLFHFYLGPTIFLGKLVSQLLLRTLQWQPNIKNAKRNSHISHELQLCETVINLKCRQSQRDSRHQLAPLFTCLSNSNGAGRS